MDRIVEANLEQRTWDSLGSFLEMGHKLITNIKMMNCLRSKAVKAQEDHQAEINHLLEEKAKVDHLLERKMPEVKDLQETI
ncbi:putative ensconsin-like [Cocos nucifera]|nr:putative ensconsin-like [Cocos nucifera]